MGKHTESHANMTKGIPRVLPFNKTKQKNLKQKNKSVLLQIQILVKSSVTQREWRFPSFADQLTK